MRDGGPLASFCAAHRLRTETRGRVTRLVSTRTGAPVARLRAMADGDRVQVQWWNGERWAAPGPFGIPTMPLNEALAFIAAEPAFWIHA